MAAGNKGSFSGLCFQLRGLLQYLNYSDKSPVFGPDSMVLQIQYEVKKLDD